MNEIVRILRKILARPEQKKELPAVVQQVEARTVSVDHRRRLAAAISRHSDVAEPHEVHRVLSGDMVFSLEDAMLAGMGFAAQAPDIDLTYLGVAQSDALFSVVARGARRSGEDIVAFAGDHALGQVTVVLPTAAGVRNTRDTKAQL